MRVGPSCRMVCYRHLALVSVRAPAPQLVLYASPSLTGTIPPEWFNSTGAYMANLTFLSITSTAVSGVRLANGGMGRFGVQGGYPEAGPRAGQEHAPQRGCFPVARSQGVPATLTSLASTLVSLDLRANRCDSAQAQRSPVVAFHSLRSLPRAPSAVFKDPDPEARCSTRLHRLQSGPRNPNSQDVFVDETGYPEWVTQMTSLTVRSKGRPLELSLSALADLRQAIHTLRYMHLFFSLWLGRAVPTQRRSHERRFAARRSWTSRATTLWAARYPQAG
jgi:hypothetical protein